MIEISEFTLISGAPVLVAGHVFVYPPRLCDIRDIGFDAYRKHLSILMLNKEEFLESLGYKDTSDHGDMIQIITLTPTLRDALMVSLSFFIRKLITYDDDLGFLIGEEKDPLSLDEIRWIRGVILTLCKIDDDEEKTPTSFASDKAKAIYEKIHKHKKQKKSKGKASPALELPNLIGALAASGRSYNLLNIWDLTIYQFYDQFARTNLNIQTGILGQRWAAWGKEDFDFSIWYKPTSNKQK